ncbi:MAG: phosphatase PAP2 family protein [Bacillota bacterium]|nr:phosphatase PAP2 family protein [Bacillota bacterium]
MTRNKLAKAKSNLSFSFLGLGLVLVLGYFTTKANGGIFKEELVFELLKNLRANDSMFFLMKIFHHLGSPRFLVPFIGFVFVYSLFKKKKTFAWSLLMASAGSAIFNYLTKITFQRQRPLAYMLVEEFTQSYPSGHAMTNTCMYLFLAYFYGTYVNPKRKGLAFGLAIFFSLVMGFSRVYMGVHYPSDVIGGFLSGYFFYCLTVFVLEYSRASRSREA